MKILANIRNYWRIAAGLGDYAARPTPADFGSLMRLQVQERERNWLVFLQRAVFQQARHPYRRMFELAGCQFADLEYEVAQHGIETILERLYDGGVYLTLDEFKGRTPIVRCGEEIPSTPEAFRNPLEKTWFDGSTSGSSGTRTRVPYGSGALFLRDAVTGLAIEEFDLQRYKRLIFRPSLPSAVGLGVGLSMGRLGCPMHEWFATGGSGIDSMHYRLLTRYVVQLGRLRGATTPAPTYLRRGDFTTPVEWVARHRGAGIASMISSFVSPAVRMAAVARERGWDISDSLFLSGGEMVTKAKLDVLRSVGAHITQRYWVSEIGPVGISCRSMTNQNRMHLLRGAVAVISRQRPAPFVDGTVDAGLLTSVSPHCASVLVNAEMGDSFSVRPTPCGCTFGRAGLDWEIGGVSSYAKLTGQGMTLMGADVVAVLEEQLPRKFGGAPGDYQLVERPAEGQTELELRVSPRVGASSTEDVKNELVHCLRRAYGGSLATRVWQHSDGLRVVVREPFATPTGKVPPLHLASSHAKNGGSDEP